MLYVTTRNKEEVYTAHKTLTENRAADGGFFVPFRMPVFSKEEIASLEKKSFGHCVAEVLNKRAGRKASDENDLSEQLGTELADMIHYIVAIAAINDIDLERIIVEKDRKASIKYNHRVNLETFLSNREE